MDTLRIVLVDDDVLLLELIGENLSARDDVDVVGSASDGYEGIRILDNLDGDVDVLLLDVAMPGLSGPKTARLARSKYPDLTIVMFTAFEKDSMLSESLHAGANGFLTKDMPTDDLIDSLRRAVEGETVIGRKPMSLLTGAYLGDKELSETDLEFESAFSSLSDRYRDIIVAIAQGLTNEQIATKLHLGSGTVRGYVSDVLQRTGCGSRTEVAVKAVRLGLVRR